ncbi:pyruvate dehydrogenase (acetyl-transferring) E1 component subunit alpha [Micromonospora sp. WMMD882]|uniref:pyruvate dehydrogenase (acetyl-transferring) E1 component subunit alpha n=1 Tax=Micromonospora sp. WMMD882 TaxID=3015151 RepID=UPI00248D2B46|nr:pyruvate dehydrogenase (acetyl-transferring) E1 component subunit alpha [Micromonospora sp. WMMD882]WBB80891.1 pyruvate dehydrogenase (acetyl-transferring) E1 component subunit alpha [Micromonospora sp. WMMD882]
MTTTPQAVRRAPSPTRRTATPSDPARELLPSAEPVRMLDPTGTPLPTDLPEPPVETLREMHRRMVVGRRFDAQATALTKQGKLAVYPSARGQEACQIGAILALRDTDWLFPTYRESMALVCRGIDPVEVLTLLRGDWHCGYDPVVRHTAPQCTPLATQCVHAAGLAHGEAYQGRDTVALAFVGDGATSEGDFHEGVNFAAVFKAPVVFFVQNNRYAISVPLSRQTAAPSLAYKGVGYGVPAEQVDGNDPVAVLAVLTRAVAHARAGLGPYLVEAHTYRMEAHTNADDATRYRDRAEVEAWRDRDPVARLETYLRARGVLDDAAVAEIDAEAEAYAADLRARMHDRPAVDPMSLFEHVYAEPTPQLREQREQVRAELAAETEQDGGR